MSDRAEPLHHIILIHGIRTHAQWFELGRQVFDASNGYKVHPVKYGRFDLLRFMLPGPWRDVPIRRTRSKIAAILQKARENDAPITVIAHSYGTHVITALLKQEPDLRLCNLILCGSVVHDDFDWNVIAPQVSGVIVNDCGVLDPWPAAARSLTWGYGYSGTNGVGSPIEDRMHALDHSGYFTTSFMETYWRSLTDGRGIARPPLGPDGAMAKSPWYFPVFELPLRWLMLGLLLGMLLLGIAALTAPWRTEAVVPPPTRPPSVLEARGLHYLDDGKWPHVTIYSGVPINAYEDNDLRPLVLSRSSSWDDDTGGGVRTQAILDGHKIAVNSARYRALVSCAQSLEKLKNCPIDLTAIAVEIFGANYDTSGPVLKSMEAYVPRLVLSKLEAARIAQPAPASLALANFRVDVGNRTTKEQRIYAVRVVVRHKYAAGGQGRSTSEPRRAFPDGTQALRLFDALAINCALPRVPAATFEFPAPITIPARSSGVVDFAADTRLYHRIVEPAIAAEGTETGDAWRSDDLSLIKRQCEAQSSQRRKLTDLVPIHWRSSLDRAFTPLYGDRHNVVLALSVKNDGGWIELGLFNILVS